MVSCSIDRQIIAFRPQWAWIDFSQLGDSIFEAELSSLCASTLRDAIWPQIWTISVNSIEPMFVLLRLYSERIKKDPLYKRYRRLGKDDLQAVWDKDLGFGKILPHLRHTCERSERCRVGARGESCVGV